MSNDLTSNNTTLNYINNIQKNLNINTYGNLSPKLKASKKIKSDLSFSSLEAKNNKNDVFITFKLDNAKKVNNLIEDNLYTFSNNINNNYIINNNNFSSNNSNLFLQLNTKNFNENNKLNKNQNKQTIKNSYKSNRKDCCPSRKFDYIHYTDAEAHKHEYKSHNINFENSNIYQNNINNSVNSNNVINFNYDKNTNNKNNKSNSGSEFYKQNFLERRNQIIKERISRSLSNSKNYEKRRNLFGIYFSIPKNNQLQDLKNFYYESDKESANFRNSLGEFNKDKNNSLICNLRNIKHNHNQTYSRYDFKKAAYEKDAKKISFLAFKINQHKANEIKKLNFLDSQNRIRSQHGNTANNNCYLQSPEISVIGLKENNLNLIKSNFKEDDHINNEYRHEELNNSTRNENGISCKMINDSEMIIKWLKSLKIKNAEKLEFFEDAYKDNTKYIKNTMKESIMSEIKKGYLHYNSNIFFLIFLFICLI